MSELKPLEVFIVKATLSDGCLALSLQKVFYKMLTAL